MEQDTTLLEYNKILHDMQQYLSLQQNYQGDFIYLKNWKEKYPSLPKQQMPPSMQQMPPSMQQMPPSMQQMPPSMQQMPPSMQQIPLISTSKPIRKDSSVDLHFLKFLQSQCETCTRCSFHKHRKNTLFGEGTPTCQLLVVVSSPSKQDDEENKVIANIMYDNILKVLNLTREQIYTTYLIKCYSEKTILPENIKACQEHLKSQLKIIRPKIICALDYLAAQFFLPELKFTTIEQYRREIHYYTDKKTRSKKTIPVICTYSPEHLQKKPEDKQDAYQDLYNLKKYLAS